MDQSRMRRLSIAISAAHAASTSPSVAALTAVAKNDTLANIAGCGSSGWCFDQFAGSMPRSSQRDVFRRHFVTQLTARSAVRKPKLVPIAAGTRTRGSYRLGHRVPHLHAFAMNHDRFLSVGNGHCEGPALEAVE